MHKLSGGSEASKKQGQVNVCLREIAEAQEYNHESKDWIHSPEYGEHSNMMGILQWWRLSTWYPEWKE